MNIKQVGYIAIAILVVAIAGLAWSIPAKETIQIQDSDGGLHKGSVKKHLKAKVA